MHLTRFWKYLSPLLIVAFFGNSAHGHLSEVEIQGLLDQMSLQEKIKLIGGNDFETFAIPRLNIPALKMTDGPLGVHYERATAFPAGIAYGASFDPRLIQEMAVAMADETRAKGRHMLLGPCVNISRNPFGGRNFESYGEDPYLTGQIASAFVRGVQSRGILTSVKHFAVNDQEFERMSIDVKVDPRALFEIHFPAFQSALDSGAWTVMAAYNKVNGFFATENSELLNHILKGMWHFKGFVVSDWGATHSIVPAANGGLDLEMPFGENFNSLAPYVQNGDVSIDTINDKVRRILRAMSAIDLIGRSAPPAPAPVGPENKAHQELARRVARESAVLLKNDDHLLPLKPTIKNLAVLGPNASVLRTGGGGSSHVDAWQVVTPLDGLKELLGPAVHIAHASGVRLPGESGEENIPDAVAAAKSAEAAVIFAGLGNDIESEGVDRTSMALPAGQVELIKAVAAVNPNTVVVLLSGNPLEMQDWIGQVKSVVHFWYPGQEGGRAMADVLFGRVNPSGKLPVTFLKRWEDSPAYGHYPGTNGMVDYAEGIFVGYRHFDHFGITPQFPFGFGLSYTTFAIKNLNLEVMDNRAASPKVRVTFDVTNTGSVAGAEVPQVYVGERQPRLPRPVRELKGFQKIFLKAGETKTVSIYLNTKSFAYFDPVAMDFRVDPGLYTIEVGASSRDLGLKKSLRLL